jgi:hypothetical protein
VQANSRATGKSIDQRMPLGHFHWPILEPTVSRQFFPFHPSTSWQQKQRVTVCTKLISSGLIMRADLRLFCHWAEQGGSGLPDSWVLSGSNCGCKQSKVELCSSVDWLS